MTPTASPANGRPPAVCQISWIGDQLLALPALRAIDSLHPGGVQLLLGEGMLSFFYRGLLASEPIRIRWAECEGGRTERIAAAARPCDLFACVSRHPPPFLARLARSLGATRSLGLSEAFDHPVRVEPGSHVFEQLFAVARALDPSLRFDAFAAPPEFSPAAEAAARRFVEAARGRGERILFLHAETKPDRIWPEERFASVVERFLERRPEHVVLVASLAPLGALARCPRVRRIAAHLEVALAIVRHADLFLGVDSCFLHAADLFRVPGVALFGPTNPREWGFRLSPRSRHVAAASMDRVDEDSVLEALEDVAGGGGAPAQ